MDRDIEIAAATWADLDGIHRLEAKSFPSPWRRDFFESELRGESRFHLVARRGGLLIGYLFAMWFFDEMHVNKIAVAESERKRLRDDQSGRVMAEAVPPLMRPQSEGRSASSRRHTASL